MRLCVRPKGAGITRKVGLARCSFCGTISVFRVMEALWDGFEDKDAFGLWAVLERTEDPVDLALEDPLDEDNGFDSGVFTEKSEIGDSLSQTTSSGVAHLGNGRGVTGTFLSAEVPWVVARIPRSAAR